MQEPRRRLICNLRCSLQQLRCFHSSTPVYVPLSWLALGLGLGLWSKTQAGRWPGFQGAVTQASMLFDTGSQ